MVKIGILTFHKSVNNGAVMQAHSLSTRLQREFPETKVEIIDYNMIKVQKSYQYRLRDYLKSDNFLLTLKKCIKLMLDPMKIKRLKKRTRVFENCQNKLILSPELILSDEQDMVFRYINANYDILIVGSDAIWNFISRGFPNAYLPDKTVTCPKLSYAASCYGMDFLTLSEEDRKKIGEALADFDFVGVRDKATEDFVEWSGSEIASVHTCDPTVFLDVDNLPIDVPNLKRKMQDRGFDFSKPALGVMGNPKMVKMVRRLYGKKYQIVALYEYSKDADVNLYDIEPFEWAYAFKYFKVTFTTYFHGTLLSLRNGVPVVCFALKTDFAKKHTPKTLDILKRLGFEEWYFETDYENVNIDEIKKKADELIECQPREEILSKLRKEGESFELFKKSLAEKIGEKRND